MKRRFLRIVLALLLCTCLAVTLSTAFFPIRSAHAATISSCQTLRFPLGQPLMKAGSREQWTTCAGNTMDLNMQTDGNFVLYLNGQPIWATNTTGNIFDVVLGDWARFQSDGNLVVYNIDLSANNLVYPAWQSNTRNEDANELEMQSDGNVVIYNIAGTGIWSTHTNGH